MIGAPILVFDWAFSEVSGLESTMDFEKEIEGGDRRQDWFCIVALVRHDVTEVRMAVHKHIQPANIRGLSGVQRDHIRQPVRVEHALIFLWLIRR